MKIGALRNDLLDVLHKLEPLTRSKVSVEVVKHMLITAKDGKVSISATNLELGCTLYLNAKVEVEGTATVDPTAFIDFVETLSKKENYRVDLELQPGTPDEYKEEKCKTCDGTGEYTCGKCNGTGTYTLPFSKSPMSCTQCTNGKVRCVGSVGNGYSCNGGTVKTLVGKGQQYKLKAVCGKKSITLKSIDPDEFPAMPALPGQDSGNILALDKAALYPAIERVLPAVSKEDNRPILTGMLLRAEWDEGITDTARFVLAGADGWRLHVDEFGISKQLDFNVIVPAASLRYLMKTASAKQEGDLLVERGTGSHTQQLFISWPEGMIVTQLIDGKFPDYQQIVPKTWNSTYEVGKPELLEAIKTAAIYARHNANTIYLDTVPNGTACKQVIVSAVSQEHGEVSTELDLLHCDLNEKMPIAVNFQYVQEALQVSKSNRVMVRYNGYNAPVLLIDQDSSFKAVVMPMSKDRSGR